MTAGLDDNRIVRRFARLRAEGRTALMPFITAGYPDLETSLALLPRLKRAGASIVEIGIPFSDPIADGPVIASSMHEALERGFRFRALLKALPAVRSKVNVGLVAMASYSIAHRIGLERFIQACAAAGFDGFIFPDLPVEESDEARRAAANEGTTCSLLIAPTTPIERAATIARACTGFAYLLARAGITGERTSVPDLLPRVAPLRERAEVPIACGFGIASAEAVRAVTQVADAAIVGSAIVRRIGELKDGPREALLDQVEAFVGELASGLATRPGSASASS